MPFIANLAITWFQPADLVVGLQFRKTLEVFLIVLVPVAIGMAVRAVRPGFAQAMDRPVRVASIAILLAVIVGAVLANRQDLTDNLVQLGGVAIVFCAVSLGVGYGVPRALKVDKPQAIACGFEVGIHNATLAIVVAQSVLNQPEIALPAAVYAAVMFPMAALFGLWIRRT